MAWPSMFETPKRGETRAVDVRAEVEVGMLKRWFWRAREGLDACMLCDLDCWSGVEVLEVALVKVEVSEDLR